jgi:sigma-B regulation protein RsbU (phosphoserine phosphatase)
MPDLFIYPRRGEPYTRRLSDAPLCLGRGAENDVVLPDQFCSTSHAVIRMEGGRSIVRDQGSKNGTYVNGRRVEGEQALRPGDEIVIGSTRIVFDREATTRVDIVDGAPLLAGQNTIIGVRDILRSPSGAAPGRTPGPATEMRLRQEQRILKVLNEVSQALIYHMPLEKLYDHIMDLIARNIPMDRGALMLRDSRSPELIPHVVRLSEGGPESDRAIEISRSILNTVLEKNSAVLITDILTDAQFRDQASVVQSRIHSALCVPLWNNRDIVGLVYADRAGTPERFTEDDLRLLTLLANVAAVKIENARLFEEALENSRIERELELATQIQRNFLPREDPAVPGYDISGRARACCHVGGDYYDFLQLGEGRWGLVIADVSGSGVSAALLMASVRAALHAEARPGVALPELAYRLNAFVHRSSEVSGFISFFYGELEAASGRFRFFNAGHNSPLLLRSGADVEALDGTGLCLGMFPASSYEAREVLLHPGDALCLYTDGITESRTADKVEFGEEGLLRVLRESAALSSGGTVERIFEATAHFSGCAEPSDDATVVLVKRLPAGDKP